MASDSALTRCQTATQGATDWWFGYSIHQEAALHARYAMISVNNNLDYSEAMSLKE